MIDARQIFIDLSYLGASIAFILGLKGMTHPDSARRGMTLAEVGMFLAIIGTLLNKGILDYTSILIGLVVGSIIGALIAAWTPMTAMPQRTALSHACGALAVTLVGVAEYYQHGAELSALHMGAIGFEVLFGALTFTGSLIAMAKLQELMKGTPLTFKGQNLLNVSIFGVLAFLFICLIFHPGHFVAFYLMLALSLISGIFLVLPIGAADMPVVISLLNSYAGLAACATGFALGNNILIIAGALDGASGFILSVIMCKAMNRSITNVMFGAFGQAPKDGAAAAITGSIREFKPEDVALTLTSCSSLIIVPGYGLAVSRAQNEVKELADLLIKKGVEVRYAIHPVAGRMPGHMNVLLAEANVPYAELFDMESINDSFKNTDVVMVVGANDVTNPAAKTNQSSPIYGMPVLNVDQARTVFFLKRSMKPGFAGIENELFFNEKTYMVFGDAKATLNQLIHEVKNG